MAVVRVEAPEQRVEPGTESLEPEEPEPAVEPEEPEEPEEPWEPAVPLEPPAEPPDDAFVWSVRPEPVEAPSLASGDGVPPSVGDAVAAEPADAPSSWTPCPLSHAVSASVAAVSAAATRKRVRWVRVDM